MTENNKELHTCYKQGILAGKEDIARHGQIDKYGQYDELERKNPYNSDTEFKKHVEWDKGWEYSVFILH